MQGRIALYVLIYKLACLGVGAASLLMGFRLFYLGGTQATSAFAASHGTDSLKLTSTAPGLFFALFGTAIIGFSVLKGFNLTEGQRRNGDSSSTLIGGSIHAFNFSGLASPTAGNEQSPFVGSHPVVQAFNKPSVPAIDDEYEFKIAGSSEV